MKSESTKSVDNGRVAKSYVTSFEAAKILDVTVRTVQLWANSGLLQCWKTEGGHRRIARDSVERLLVSRGQNESPAVIGTAATPEIPDVALRILVVEDEPNLLRLYRMQLAGWALAPEVATAANGFEGLVILGSLRPHLLITDLFMPEMDGFQMLRILRSMPQLDSTEIVAVTGVDAEEIAERGGLPEGMAILPKPIPFAKLEQLALRLAAENGCRGGARA